ncbi:MAG: hypothetical protein NZM18_06555 [Thermoflexales bacterium]|nr:hypothetical protein [Thermoflexales bacterium]MDW8352312.1 hypothetical protein [Anaerolineae bacterium]
MVAGIVVLVLGLIIGLILLTGNFWPGYNQGFNMVGWVPVLLGLANGIPLIAFGAVLRLLTDVEYSSRAAMQVAEQSRKSAEAAVKNSEMLMKNTETLMRNTEIAVRNTETALKSVGSALTPASSTASGAMQSASGSAPKEAGAAA